MARHFSVPAFFRLTPNALLKRYFSGRAVLQDFDFENLPETRPQALMSKWLALPDSVRGAMEADFRGIFDVSSERGYRAILDEAKYHVAVDSEAYVALVEKLAALPGHADRAMTVFLDHHEMWRGVTRFSYADSLPYWRKRRGLPAKKAALDLDSRIALQSSVGAWFREKEGRGRNCLVELLRRDERDYFFVYPEDFGSESMEWVNGEFSRRPHNPAFEVMYVWSEKEGVLDFHYRGGIAAVEPLQALFAKHVLKLDKLPPNPRDGRVYDLNPLKRREFQFVRPAGGGIDSVRVRLIRLSSTVRQGDRVTLEADVSENELAIYDVLEQVGRSLALNLWNVTRAEIVVHLSARGDKPGRREVFTIGYPNACSLKHDDLGLKLRGMLAASGIEPK
ncbi:MAG TPA: hypothetical protein VE999_02100 [Gemmataceae bacterium]|jgi:hypothetical protein|nr:hypothetical protein [Reyranella sp.]HZV03859.1 hypothetical protein [Gemmataceae bacterium]